MVDKTKPVSSSTASKPIPYPLTGIAPTASTFGERPISAKTFKAAEAALLADPINGQREAYSILYAATGNPAFSSNMFIATGSGQIGGMAWNANQQILEKYPEM
jgi:hypothetical protein